MNTHPLPSRAFYFVRHGETQFNVERRFQGSVDVPLNDNGVQQAKRAARVLSGHSFSRIVASPASRVLTTAGFIAGYDETPIHIEQDLMEFHVGSLEGQCISSTMKLHGIESGASILSILPDDADKWHEFVPRICSAVSRWTDRYADETLLIVSHGLVFRALTEILLGQSKMSKNAVPFEFKPGPAGWTLSELSQT